jgi:RNA polymerase primary sigma factor
VDGKAAQIVQTGAFSQATPTPEPNTAEIVKGLLTLAREQGRLSHEEIGNALPDECPPEQRDAIYTRLQELGIELREAEGPEEKLAENETEEERQLEALDDPVRQYLQQIGRVPLLTREQEVEVFKRIEQTGFEIKMLI